MALLAVKEIDVFYGSIQALRGVSLEVREGEMVALLGANGAGKTTTLRTLSGLLAPFRGSITLAGEEIGGLPAQEVVKHGIAHLPEGRDLFPTLTVEENLRFGYLPRRKDKAAYAGALEQAFTYFPKLKERRRQAAGTMSGGEQQMLGVARALMSNPRLLIVDELSLGLAPIIVEQLFQILADVNRAGTSILIVEQFVHMALANTHRAYVLAKGEIVLENTSDALGRDPQLVASYLGEAEAGTVEVEPAGAASAPTPPAKPARSRRPAKAGVVTVPEKRTARSFANVAGSPAAARKRTPSKKTTGATKSATSAGRRRAARPREE